MRKHLIQFLLVAVLLVFTSAAWAQTTVHGQLVDAETGEPLVGAAVMVEGTTQGSVTDIDGYFKQSVASNATLLFKYIGYKDQKKKITQKGASVELGTIKMQPDAVMLSDVTITSSVAVARKTPVAVSTVDPVFIEEKLGSQEFPEILKSTPGIYTTKDGGGYGDAQTRIRGFKSENVAMMINGVPMNGMENQKVYWSNWAGLSDVTRSMQVQRGLGAAKVSVPAVGGSINIVTKSTEAKRGGFVSYGMGNDGYTIKSFSAYRLVCPKMAGHSRCWVVRPGATDTSRVRISKVTTGLPASLSVSTTITSCLLLRSVLRSGTISATTRTDSPSRNGSACRNIWVRKALIDTTRLSVTEMGRHTTRPETPIINRRFH